LAENQTDACVANGRAFGPGFGFCEPDRPVRHLPDKKTLCRFLGGWLVEEWIGRNLAERETEAV
jgi:hypothetical protein